MTTQDSPNAEEPEEGAGGITIGEPIAARDISRTVLPEPARREIDQASIQRVKASKPVVARFITSTLLILFVCQMAVFTLAYLASVYIDAFIDKGTADVVSQSTEAILDGVRAIMPVTTTFLGVAIGFYFREVKAEEEAQEANQ